MLDRSTPPPIKEVETLTFPEVDSCCLPNGIPLYIIDRGDQELSRVDILFSAGKVQERQPLTQSSPQPCCGKGRRVFLRRILQRSSIITVRPCRHWQLNGIRISPFIRPTDIFLIYFRFCVSWLFRPIFPKKSFAR